MASKNFFTDYRLICFTKYCHAMSNTFSFLSVWICYVLLIHETWLNKHDNTQRLLDDATLLKVADQVTEIVSTELILLAQENEIGLAINQLLSEKNKTIMLGKRSKWSETNNKLFRRLDTILRLIQSDFQFSDQLFNLFVLFSFLAETKSRATRCHHRTWICSLIRASIRNFKAFATCAYLRSL